MTGAAAMTAEESDDARNEATSPSASQWLVTLSIQAMKWRMRGSSSHLEAASAV